MADLNKTVAIIFDATDLTSDKLAKIQGGLQGLVKDTDDAGASAEKAGKQIDSMGKDGEASVLSLANAMKTLAASFVVQEFLEANTEAQKLEATFTVLTGSSAAAAAELDYIRGVADKLGVNANELASSFATFSAATQGTAVEGAQAKLIFEAFAGTMATLGSSTEDISGAMVQLSQGVSKGRFELDDLKSIAERVPGFFNTMAEAVGVSTSELFKLVSQGEITGEVMAKVADTLKEKYGDVAYIDTFEAAWNRLKNVLTEFSTSAGETGTMDKLTNAINVSASALDYFAQKLKEVKSEEAGTLGVDESTLLQLTGPAGGITNLIEKLLAIGGAYLKIRESADGAGSVIQKFLLSIDSADAEGLQQIQVALQQMYKEGNLGAQEYNVLQDAILSKAQGVWHGVSDEIQKTELSTKELQAAAKQVDAALKALGLDPKQIYEPVEEAAAKVQAAISDLVNNPTTKPEEMFTGLIVAIDQLTSDQLPALKAAAQGALDEGKLDADQYAAVMDAIEQKAGGSWPQALDKTAAAVKKQADESEKAKEAANKYALELEKLASNEKIALIESKVKLDIAEVEANAQIAAATLDALASNYASATSLIGDLLSGLTDNANTAADQIKIGFAKEFAAQASEMHAAEMAFIAAQIDYYQMKTSLMAQGNPVVTIQGDGLAPHLEAIMWEVLKQIQVKMAIDGGDMLVGGIQ